MRRAGRPCAANLGDVARPTVTSAAKTAMSRITAVMNTDSSATPVISLAIRRSSVLITRVIVQHSIDVDARCNNRFSLLYSDDDGDNDNDIPNIELSGNNGIRHSDVSI